MTAALGWILLALSAAVLLPALVWFAEVAASWRGPRDAGAAPSDASIAMPSLAVLMPAHDEAAGIEAPLRAVLAQLAAFAAHGVGGRCLVVADNCSDATAAIARALGAEVIERHDPVRRGKGYALDAGVRHLAADAAGAPDVVVIVDADCTVAPNALSMLGRACRASGRPTQALYLMHAPAGAPLGLRIAAFAWIVKNRVRPLGAAALGWPCPLMGTGMAFPWALLRDAPLASGHLVEDMQLGLDLAAAGHAPRFCPEALVESVFPLERAAAAAQRTRWEHGHLSVIAGTAPRLLARAVSRGDGALLAMVLDLAVPPLAALVLAIAAVLALDAVAAASGLWRAPLAIAALALGLVATGVVVAWWRHARHLVSGRELIALPWYVVRKLPVYLRLFGRRQLEWVRTRRDERGR